MANVLLVDDEPDFVAAAKEMLQLHGHTVESAERLDSARRLLGGVAPDVLLLDLMLPDGNGLELLEELRESPVKRVVFITGHPGIKSLIKNLSGPSVSYLTKPIGSSELLRMVEADSDAPSRTTADGSGQLHFGCLIGESPAMAAVYDQIEKVARTPSPVLILGETGTGKGVLARWLHENSPRAEEAFVDLNCAGLSRELLETELFGHEKGAFTSATASKQGLFEVAHRGTIFLDEVGDVDLQIQPKLLKVLEEKRFRRVGDVRDRQVDVRLIAATHQDIGQLVRDKKFRDDLYFRISTIPLSFPALRERIEDIPTMAQYLLDKVAVDLGRGELRLDESSMHALQAYPWPGNIRELRNVIERAVLLSEHKNITLKDLRFDGHAQVGTPFLDTRLTLLELEKQHIERVLNEERGRVEKAAKRLGIPRSSLYQKIKKHQIIMSKV